MRELVKKSDVVVENFSAGVLNKMGLGYEQLKQDNPRIVMVSVSGFGQSGPISRNVAYGATVMALGGLTALTGYRGEEPRSAGLSYPDPNTALHGCFAVLSALWRRDRTGQGEYVDISLLESMIAVMPEGMMAQVMRGEQSPTAMKIATRFWRHTACFPARARIPGSAFACVTKMNGAICAPR